MADALVTALNRAGFQPVFMPYTNILPPELYNFARRPIGPRLVRRGPLNSYLAQEVPFTLTRSELPDITHVSTTRKDLNGSVDFLRQCLLCLGITAIPRVDLSFAGTESLIFRLKDVHSMRVDPADIDHAITGLDTDAIPQDYVDQGFLHIAYEYAFARSITMHRADGREFTADVRADIAAFIDVGAGVSVERSNDETLKISAAEDQPIPAFAYKAGRLQRGDRWRFYPDEVRRDGSEPQPYLTRRGSVLVIE